MPYKYYKNYRLHNFDYSSNNLYFITICTHDRELFFGDVVGGKIVLNKIGIITNNFYQKTPEHFENIYLDEYIVMPNHVHGIIEIRNNNDNSCRNVASLRSAKINQCNQQFMQNVAVQRSYKSGREYFSNLSPKKDSLSIVVRSFKSICTKTINKNFPNLYFSWQSRFHDRIIRNEKELDNIRKYVYYNPINWQEDRNNADGLLI